MREALQSSGVMPTRHSQLMLARSESEVPSWLPKLFGARAVVIVALGPDSKEGGASVHSRRHQLAGRLSGWPRASDAVVHLERTRPTAHVFDCSTYPLNVRLANSEVAALWLFGDTSSDTIATRQAGMALAPGS